MKPLRLVLQILLPVLVLAGTYLKMRSLAEGREPPKVRGGAPFASAFVEATPLQAGSHSVYIDSYGAVRPETISQITPQVSARVEAVSPRFREGGLVKKGEWLIRLERADFETALAVAEAAHARAELALQQEQARGRQAQDEWNRLGRKGEPDALVLRTPQLTEAVANAKASQAQVEKAKRDLQRTEIVAPYDARIRQKRADVGQTVSPGTLLAEVFALEAAEVTLSLTQREFSALGFQANMDTSTPEVTVVFDADGDFSEGRQWSGLVVRTGAEIDPATRRIPVVARIVLAEQSAPLHMGQFLQARLTSRIPYENTWAVPNQAIRGDNTLFLVTSENTLKVA